MSYALLACFLIGMVAIFLVPVFLVINGLHVVRKESFSLAHLLSLILGVGIGVGEIATVVYVLGTVRGDYSASFAMIHKTSLGLAMTVFYFSCLVLGFVLYSVLLQVLPHRMRFDYVIIHGCGLKGGEKLTKLLQNRVDKAIEIYRRCSVKPMLIPSGGQGADEKISEALAMKNYLLEQGIPEEHILIEDGSATTMENLVNSGKLIDGREGGKRTALVSSNYHLYRCLTYARKLKFKCVGIGAKVAFYFWPSALIREFIAIFTTRRFFILSMIGYVLFMLPFVAVLRYS